MSADLKGARSSPLEESVGLKGLLVVHSDESYRWAPQEYPAVSVGIFRQPPLGKIARTCPVKH